MKALILCLLLGCCTPDPQPPNQSGGIHDPTYLDKTLELKVR